LKNKRNIKAITPKTKGSPINIRQYCVVLRSAGSFGIHKLVMMSAPDEVIEVRNIFTVIRVPNN
jgi:hypothetical protein